MRTPLSLSMVWHDVLFLHWPLEPSALAPLVPPGLELDTFEGRAWLGVVPFRMSGVTPSWLPPLPGLSAFPEINVRTYVVHGGRPGVWFFSLDAAHALAVRAARRWFHLPYWHAAMTCRLDSEGAVEYRSRRVEPRAPAASFRARYAPSGPVYRARPGDLDHWLTERYCLFARDPGGGLHRGDIRHAPWPLQPAVCTLDQNRMADALLGPPLGTPATAHFARRVRVTAAPLVPLVRPSGESSA